MKKHIVQKVHKCLVDIYNMSHKRPCEKSLTQITKKQKCWFLGTVLIQNGIVRYPGSNREGFLWNDEFVPSVELAQTLVKRTREYIKGSLSRRSKKSKRPKKREALNGVAHDAAANGVVRPFKKSMSADFVAGIRFAEALKSNGLKIVPIGAD